MELINPDIEAYAQDHTTEEPELLKMLVKKSEQKLKHIDMISGKVVGELIAILIKISGAATALEIGTFVGYSALRIAGALPENGALITCDNNKRYEKIARQAFSQSKHGHKITMKMGPAMQTIPRLQQSFDFIFIDADKVNYPKYFKALVPRLNEGGLMLIDNVFWSGKVLKPDNEKTRAIDACNDMVAADERVEEVMLTVRDGLTIVRRKKENE